jgi:DNA-binding Lrp family transcriptional regulator
MQEEGRRILSLMADGADRSFDVLQIMTGVEPKALRAALDGLREAGLLEHKYARDTESFVITLRGFILHHDSVF